mgnify:CR=1 FL=1
MQLTTASEVIGFAKELEATGAKFYEELAEKRSEGRDILLSLAKENRKNKVLVQRVYNEVVTDALETGFSFEGLNVNEHIFEGIVTEDLPLSDVVHRALDLEEETQKFYLNAAEMSKSLLADIPRVFERMANGRDKRKKKLKSFLES